MAAAVSDFYIPGPEMSEHKLQSSEGAPEIRLRLVPKMLRPLVRHWVPEAFVVSFKLETDEDLLIPKARKALETYNHRLVVANLLHTRKTRVVIVSAEDSRAEAVELSEDEVKVGMEIETKIVRELKERQLKFISDVK